MILSQIVRGAAEELVSRPGELVDPVLVAAAFARAADAAYRSVREPAEGTMLTAVRAMAHRVAQDLAHMDQTRLGPGAPPRSRTRCWPTSVARARGANEAVERGPEQLRALREAGVVDAGAYGLTVIMAGVLAALRGGEVELAHQEVAERRARCTTPTTSRAASATARTSRSPAPAWTPSDFVPRLERIGDSVLVVGDAHTLRVHVHTDDPQLAVAVFEGAGEVSRLDVADMREQVAERDARLGAVVMEGVRRGALRRVAVATGEGIVAHVLPGGRGRRRPRRRR